MSPLEEARQKYNEAAERREAMMRRHNDESAAASKEVSEAWHAWQAAWLDSKEPRS